MKNLDLEVAISEDNESIVKEQEKCIQCGYCKRVCENETTVARMYDINKSRKPICINCGQCSNMCPTEAIKERMDYLKVKEILKDKNKIVAVSIAPAVRVAIGEEFDLPKGQNLEGKIISSLKEMGVKYVFDVTFTADLTIMEEAMELVTRIKKGGKLPMFTSCCPAWVKYAEIFYPELLPHLSSCKSPISMQGALIKTYFAKKEKIDPKDIVVVTVAPCTAKKYEIKRKELNDSAEYNEIENLRDTDYVLTTRELAKLIKEENIDFANIEDSKFDSPLGKGTSAGLIFGNTGGVMEAALRTAYYFIKGENLPEENIVFNKIRGMNGIKETNVNIDGVEVKCAVVNGMKSAKELIEKILNKEVEYHFVEVMNCTGGCIAGGGQPKMPLIEISETKKKRMDGIYTEDEKSTKRLCHENPEIKQIYEEFLGEPNSEISEELLHTHYEDKSYLLGGDK